MQELPHVTVATVVENGGRYLMVREQADAGVVYNQPAGHLECGESIPDAARRETLEETAWHVTLNYLLGIYQYTSAANGVSYVRLCFAATADREEVGAPLDAGILSAEWLTLDEILACQQQLRSPMVLRAIKDYQSGRQYPLTLIQQQ